MDGQTFKAREFSKTSALVLSDCNRGVGVLCTFFTYDCNGVLSNVTGCKHSYVNIETYAGTIKNPIYVNQTLQISEKLMAVVKKLIMK